MRVQVDYFSSYNIPSGCVACGNPLAPHVHVVGTSNWSGKQSVSLKFPVCEECNAASKASISASRLGCLGAILIGVVTGGLGAMLNGAFGAAGLDWALGIAGFIGGWILVRQLLLARQPAETRERLGKLNKAVRMVGFSLPSLFGSKGWIKLDFADAKYGSQFMVLNGGKP